MIRFIDLFAGMGGMRLGFEEACHIQGIESQCVLSSEIDKKARETYIRNFHEQPAGDIREIELIPDVNFRNILPKSFPRNLFLRGLSPSQIDKINLLI